MIVKKHKVSYFPDNFSSKNIVFIKICSNQLHVALMGSFWRSLGFFWGLLGLLIGLLLGLLGLLLGVFLMFSLSLFGILKIFWTLPVLNSGR